MNTNQNDGAFPIPNEQFSLTKIELFSKDILCAIIIADGARGLGYDKTDAEKAIIISKQLIDALNQ